MKYAYVGSYVRHLASGRPLAFGDVVDDKDLTPEDNPVKSAFLVEQTEASAPATPNVSKAE